MSVEIAPSINELEVHDASEAIAGSASDAAEVNEKRIEEPENPDTKASIADGSAKNVEENILVSKKEQGERMIRYYEDDRVFAVWSDIQQRMIFPEDIPEMGVHGYSDTDHSIGLIDHRIMIIAHDLGPKFVVPWRLCVKWEMMKNIIKATYRDDEKAKQKVEDGKFIMRRGNVNILHEHWESVVGAWQYVVIKLDDSDDSDDDMSSIDEKPSSKEDSKPDKQEGTSDAVTVYEEKVKYKFDFFVVNEYSNQVIFLDNQVFDSSVKIERSGSSDDTVPIIEEILHITFGSAKNQMRREKMSTHGLTLAPDDRVKPKRLHIRSDHLLNALRVVIKYLSSVPFEEAEVLTSGLFFYPFQELYHHREELLAYKKETGGARANHTAEYNAECDRHIDVLIDYLDHEPTVQLQFVKERWSRKVPTTTFASFWLLMKPGSDVYVQEHGQLNAYVVDHVNGGMDDVYLSLNAVKYRVQVWQLVFDGTAIRRRSKTIEVPVFDGEREIVSLPIFPTSFHDKLDDGVRRRQLIERGTKFFQYAQGPSFLEYTGTGLRTGRKKYHHARVVVEHQSLPWKLEDFSSTWDLSVSEDVGSLYNTRSRFIPPPPPPPPDTVIVGGRARAPRCECSRCNAIDNREGTSMSATYSDYDYIEPKSTASITDHQALLCMSHMFGFVLKDRKYDILDLSGLTEPRLAESAIDELVMRPEKNKETIKAIARTYTESDGQADLLTIDFIRGKGEGQIFLLHGPPGTGKTLTAESVAEYTKRPLLSITAADLGHEPIELESNLLRIFKNATAWDAIVLLDEADIYLERRASNDLRRNSIVSIFLRALDYFQGILFFTTNRVGQFDEAFLSRIHVAIGYDPLDDYAREQIWDTFFKKLSNNHKTGGSRIDYEYDAKQYVRRSEDVKKLQWNGREIRNVFQTAVALAIAEAKTAKEKGKPPAECIPQLSEAHLRQVVEMSTAFKTYIKATHEGIDDADYAYRLGNRYDRHVRYN